MNKKLFLLLVFLLLSLISVNASILCYQESVNISNQTGIDGNCGLKYTGNYYCDPTSGNNNGSCYMNYTIPIDYNIGSNYFHNILSNNLWKVKRGNINSNISLPDSSMFNNKISLKILTGSIFDGLFFEGSNGFYNNGSTFNRIFADYSSNGGGAITAASINNIFDGNYNTYTAWIPSNGWYTYNNGLYGTEALFDEAMIWNITDTVNYSFVSPNGVFGETSNIILNLSKGVNQSYNGAKLIYNGVTYNSPTQTDYGSYVLYTQQITNNALGNFTYYWNVSLIDYGNQFNFTTVNNTQLIEGLNTNFTIYDINTLTKINTTTTTITLQGLINTYTQSSGTGLINFTNLRANTYLITVSNPSYGTNTLYLTLTGNNNNLNTNIYLDNQSTLKTFTIKDNSGFVVSGANINIYKASPNGTLAITQITTDPTGTANIYLNSNIYYQFIITKTGFQTLDTSFIPSQNTYQLVINKEGTSNINSAFDDISYSTKLVYNPTTQIATLTYLITSDSGALSYYGDNATYNGISQFTNITNQPQGSIITTNININNASVRTIKVDFWFKHVNKSVIPWSANYYIDNVVASNYTLLDGLFNDIPSIENVTYPNGQINVQQKSNPQVVSVIAGMGIILFFVIVGSVFGINGAIFGGIIGLGINLFYNFLPFYMTLLSFIILIFVAVAEGMDR